MKFQQRFSLVSAMKFQQRFSLVLLAVAVCTTNHSVFLRTKGGARKSQGLGASLAIANSTTFMDNECLSWTGGVCSSNVCSHSHGPAVCQDLYCMCPPGHCSTAGGSCVAGRNTLVARAVQFRNARYTNEVMKLECIGVVEDRFDIFKMAHGEGGDAFYMLISAIGKCTMKFDEQVDALTGPTGDYMIVHTFAGDNQEKETPTEPRLFAIRVSEAPPYADDPRSDHLDAKKETSTVVMEVAAAEKWGYHSVLHWSGLNFGVHNSENLAGGGGAGTGAFWVTDAPWPGQLPSYQGPPCTWDCGEHGSGPYTTKEDLFVGPRYVVLLSFICLVFTCCFGGCYLWYRDGFSLKSCLP